MGIKGMRWGVRSGEYIKPTRSKNYSESKPKEDENNKWKELLNKPVSEISWDELKEGLGEEMAGRVYLEI